MGAWGTGIFEDDVTLDVKGDYLEKIEAGLSAEDATAQLLDDYADSLDDEDDGPKVWYALAAVQLEQGQLQPQVRDHAIAAIDAGFDSEMWKCEEDAVEHQAILSHLRSGLINAV